jgi:outer membrane receptor for ferrienterochelin and colicins
MMKIKIIVAAIATIVAINSYAQKTPTDANIVGHVVDYNGEHLPFVTLGIKGTTIGTTTDASGHYQLINLPEGEHILIVKYLGFKPQEIIVNTEINKTIELKIQLEEDALGLNEVVISADRNEMNRKEAPVIVNSITPEIFEFTQSVNIAEGLNFTPGLRTECNCQNCGFTQLRMNGMEGPYSQILMNSRPVFSGLAGVYGLELIPANMVERMEVVRGGGSALFGGNAIAGTVNIITKEPTSNTYNLDTRYSLIGIGNKEGTALAADALLNFNASLVSEDHKTGAYLYTLMRDRQAYDENGDGFTEMVMMKNTTFGFNIYHKPGSKSKISIDGYRMNEFRRGGNKLNYLPHETEITEQVGHNILGANVAYDQFLKKNYNKLTVYSALQKVERNSYYGAMQDPDAYGYTEDLSTSVGAQLVVNSEEFIFARSTTVFGVENNANIIDDTKLGANGNPNTTLTNQSVNTLGSFVQHDWKADKIKLSLGLRYDYYTIKDFQHTDESGDNTMSNGVVVPRASIMYNINPNIRFRVGYANGYRAPQIFNEDLHIELVNASRVIHINDENLIQETSHAFTASINSNFLLKETVNDILIEGFYTRLENPFADEFYPTDTLGNFAYMRVNAEDGAFVAGVNLEINSHLNDKMDLQLGYTFQKSQFDTEQQWGEEDESASKNFMRTPNQYGYGTLSWQPNKKFIASLTANYTGSMYVPHFGLDPETTDPLEQEALKKGEVISGERLEKSETFMIIDFMLKYTFNLSKETKLQVYSGVRNVFNQLQVQHDSGMFRDAGYIYGPCQPRTINFGLKIGNNL